MDFRAKRIYLNLFMNLDYHCYQTLKLSIVNGWFLLRGMKPRHLNISSIKYLKADYFFIKSSVIIAYRYKISNIENNSSMPYFIQSLEG